MLHLKLGETSFSTFYNSDFFPCVSSGMLLNNTLRIYSLAGRRGLYYVNITSLNIYTFFNGYLNVWLLNFIQGYMVIEALNRLVLNTLGLN